MSKQLAPIALFTFNRYQHTQKTILALQRNRLAAESDLFIFSDGPRTAEEKDVVNKVRAYLSSVSGFKNVTIVKNKSNKGCAESIIDGVTSVVEDFGRVIVVEDDIVTAPEFLSFMNEALKRYENEKQVWQVSGHMFNVEGNVKEDAVFLPFISSWGWATWERAWRQFDPTMSGYEQIKRDKKLRHKFNLDGTYDYYGILERQNTGVINTWAIRWYLSAFLRGGLTLYPVKTLVENIGFDGSGTHCKLSDVTNSHQKPDGEFFKKSLLFPDVIVNEQTYQGIVLLFRSDQKVLKKIKKFVTKCGQNWNSYSGKFLKK